jgi:hypothetical protein
MAGKQSGLGDNFYIDQYDMSGDVNSLGKISCPVAVQDNTQGIKKFAVERLRLHSDGMIDFSSFFNIDAAAGAEGAHVALKGLTRSDRQLTYCRGTAIGNVAASMISKQVNYDGTRDASGAFTFAVSGVANGFGLEWGNQLTAGLRTDTTATSPATGADLGASPTSYSFGWAAYLHVISFTGTSVTVTLQDSANNSAFTSLTGGAFTAATARGTQRLVSSSSTATVRRYVRAITAGTFTSAVFAVNFVRYELAQS